MKKILRGLPLAILVFSGVALGVRLTVRDRWALFSPLFYATPLVLLSVGLAIGGGGAIWIGRRKTAAVSLAGALLCAAVGLPTAWARNPEGRTGDVRLMLWNVARGTRGWDRLAEEVRLQAPDLACFVEGGKETPEQEAALQKALPGHDRRRFPGGLILAVRGTIRAADPIRLAEGGQAVCATVAIRDRAFKIVLVDLWADPFRSRRGAFEALYRILEPLRDEPVIVLGDFNTPIDSAHFDPLRRTFVHGFESAGCGFEGTWPMPVPILAIDHLWARNVPVKACRLMGSWASDHRALVAELY